MQSLLLNSRLNLLSFIYCLMAYVLRLTSCVYYLFQSSSSFSSKCLPDPADCLQGLPKNLHPTFVEQPLSL